MKYVQLLAQGTVSEDQIDDYVEMWHNGQSDDSLHQFLGMTWDQYSQWVMHGNSILPALVAGN